ncbi:hypothetical protein DID76_01335 [Candidatus Marinamargulisbacteria bacterium SCGC AG-414-C22]|nr:hypothetical protein DID76_01335 [Candidatus Marinamargulisbacteria bacterium SCGC AG-414-C22]
MNEILGMLDALESHILEAKKIPLSDKIIIEEKILIDIIDKVRITISSNGDNVRKAVNIGDEENIQTKPSQEEKVTLIPDAEQASHDANKVKKGANDYADYILTSLQLTVTKMQNNLIKLEKNIESGREIIQKKQDNKEVEENFEQVK